MDKFLIAAVGLIIISALLGYGNLSSVGFFAPPSSNDKINQQNPQDNQNVQENSNGTTESTQTSRTTCDVCGGSGVCWYCGGTGIQYNGFPCSECGGTGKCWACGGTGFV